MAKKFVAITEKEIYTEIHKFLLNLKLNHYRTKSFAAHEALGRIYGELNDLADSITEKLIGYSDVYPDSFNIGTVAPQGLKVIATSLISLGNQIEEYADEKGFCDIENLAQELSGLGAQLNFLSNLS